MLQIKIKKGRKKTFAFYILNFYKTNNNTVNVVIKVGIDTITPYLIKVLNENSNNQQMKIRGFSIDTVDNKKEDTTESKIDYSKVESTHLIKYGLIPELVGRLPIITHVEPLDIEALKRILVEPENAIVKQYKNLLKLDNVNLKFTRNAIEEIAKIAFDKNVGARGLRGIIEKTMNEIMFEAPDIEDLREIVIGKSVIVNNEKPKIIKGKESNLTAG